MRSRLVLAPYFARCAHGARRSYRSREVSYRETERLLHDMENAAAVDQQVRPPFGAPDVPRLSRDLAPTSEAIHVGRTALLNALDSNTTRETP